jgi:hypothetical protein
MKVVPFFEINIMLAKASSLITKIYKQTLSPAGPCIPNNFDIKKAILIINLKINQIKI